MPLRRATCVLAVATAVALVGGPAAAEPTPEDRALATELFKEGRALLAQGDTAVACDRFAESQRLDPGGGTLLNLALCHEALGKTATAWAELVEALGNARRDRRDDRVAVAEEHIAAIEPRLAHVVVVAANAGAGVLVMHDGAAVASNVWGVPMPVDPGTHRFDASAPGKRAWSAVVDAGAGQTRTIEIPPLDDAVGPAAVDDAAHEPARATDGKATPSDATVARTPGPPAPDEVRPRRIERLAGYGLVGLGGALTAAGAVFGWDAITQRRASDDACPAGACTQDGVDANERAKRSADVATVTTFVGLAALAAGVVVVLLATPGHAVPRVAAGAHF